MEQLQPFVFLSHASEDKPHLQGIVEALVNSGIKVWIDQPDQLDFDKTEIDAKFYRIHAGGKWEDEIDDALKGAECVIVCWSRNAAKPGRDILLKEINYAQVEGKLVACRIDDVDPATLPGTHSNHEVRNLSNLEDTRGAAGMPVPRDPKELDTALGLFVDDVKRKRNNVREDNVEAVVQTQFENPLKIYLVDRTDQEDDIEAAWSAINAKGSGVHAFFLAGPENECPDEFLDRLDTYTVPDRLDASWHRILVEWPGSRTGLDDFAGQYRSKLARALGLHDQNKLAATLRDKGLVAAISLVHLNNWAANDDRRLSEWLNVWHELARGQIGLKVIPIVCMTMDEAEPGWSNCPDCHPPGAECSSRMVHDQVSKLVAKRSNPDFEPSGHLPFSMPPVFHPINLTHTLSWATNHFEPAARRSMQKIVKSIFGSANELRSEIPLRDFAEELEPHFSET